MNFPSAKHSPSGALFTESPIRDLEAIIRSRTPLIVMESTEEPQIVRMARQIAQRQQLKAYRWTVTDGLQALDPSDQPLLSVSKSHEVLNFIKNSSSYSLFVLLDFHPYLQDAVHVRHLKDIALFCSKNFVTVMLVGYALKMPEELLPFTAQFRLPLPSPDEVRGIVFDVAGEWGAEHGQRDVQTTNKAIDLLVRNPSNASAVRGHGGKSSGDARLGFHANRAVRLIHRKNFSENFTVSPMKQILDSREK